MINLLNCIWKILPSSTHELCGYPKSRLLKAICYISHHNICVCVYIGGGVVLQECLEVPAVIGTSSSLCWAMYRHTVPQITCTLNGKWGLPGMYVCTIPLNKPCLILMPYYEKTFELGKRFYFFAGDQCCHIQVSNPQ